VDRAPKAIERTAVTTSETEPAVVECSSGEDIDEDSGQLDGWNIESFIIF
jgi:hypothetical protein